MAPRVTLGVGKKLTTERVIDIVAVAACLVSLAVCVAVHYLAVSV